MSKKLKKNIKLNNFVVLHGEFFNSSCYLFTAFIICVLNLYIKDESLKAYFYLGNDENSKAIHDTIVGCSYGKCTFQKFVDKIEKISWNNKASRTIKFGTRRNTFAVKATTNNCTNYIYKELE